MLRLLHKNIKHNLLDRIWKKEDGRHILQLNKVVKAMKYTGKDMPRSYKETSLGWVG